jgi:tight adherence protein B
MKRSLIVFLAAALLAGPASASAAMSAVQIRHVDLTALPQVRATVLAPAGTRPLLFENGRGAAFAKTRQLGSAEALVLAIDNSESMQGRPMREAKHAAREFLLDRARQASAFGLVAFGHEALVLTRSNELGRDVARTVDALAPDTVPGTALYDAVVSAVGRLRHLSSGARILVVLTDGRDVGSVASLHKAVTSAQSAGVTVYAIAAGARADLQTLRTLASSTGGRVYDSADVSELAATYATLGRELDRTWVVTYLARSRPGDSMGLRVQAGAASTSTRVRIPGAALGKGGPLPADVVHKGFALFAVVTLAALLLAAAGVGLVRSQRTPEIRRILDPHISRREQQEPRTGRRALLDPLFDWAEASLEELPGHDWLTGCVERAGVKLRIGQLPFLALAGAFVFGVFALILAVGPILSLVFLLIGFASPLVALKFVGARRAKAFDRQLPDMLATIASTLRAGHGLRTALRSVADDGSPPASEELVRVLGEERLGRPLDEAINAMCARIGSADMEYVATAINVQTQAGGSLATLFDTLSETVRERQRHARKVHALTSMGRMSATILTCLPFGLAALMTMISPSYMAPFLETSTGHILIAFCLVSMTVGALVLKRIVNVRY